MTQIRHALARSLPRWLSGPLAQSFFVEGLGTLYDVDSQWMQAALFQRFPSLCDPSALPYLLADRRLRRGPYTSDLAVRRYLKLWIDQWQLAGLPAGLLLAVQAFLAPEYPQVRIWTRSQICYTLAKGATGSALGLPGYEPLAPGPDGDRTLGERLRWSGLLTRANLSASPVWDWDSISHPAYATRWWHFWLIIAEKPLWAPWYYDQGVLYNDPAYSWGSHYPHGEQFVLRQIIRDFSPHGARPHTVILSASEGDFDPADPNAGNPAFGWPDGQWGWEAKPDGLGGAVSARRTDLRYWHSKEGD